LNREGKADVLTRPATRLGTNARTSAAGNTHLGAGGSEKSKEEHPER